MLRASLSSSGLCCSQSFITQFTRVGSAAAKIAFQTFVRNDFNRKETTSHRNIKDKTVPIAVKVSPDLNTADLTKVVEIAMALKADAIIATNTTTARTGKCVDSKFSETGGLSGNLLNDLSTHTIKAIAEIYPMVIYLLLVLVVSVQLMMLGASLLLAPTVIQLYSSMVFQGSDHCKTKLLKGSLDYSLKITQTTLVTH